MAKKEPEPKNLLTTIIGWIVVIMVLGYFISIISTILLAHWKLILLVLLLGGGIAAWALYQKWKNRWY